MVETFSFVLDNLRQAFQTMSNFHIYGSLSLLDFFVCLVLIHLLVRLFLPIIKSHRKEHSD